jgi:ABC-type phosphate transport system substrate-binding protein
MDIRIKQSLIAAFMSAVPCCVHAQIAVVAGPNGPNLSKEQIANLYLGKTFKYKPIDLPEGASTRDQFYKKLADRDPSQVRAIWARIVFTGQGSAPIMLPNADAIKKAVMTDPAAVGYIDKSAVDGNVKVLMTVE